MKNINKIPISLIIMILFFISSCDKSNPTEPIDKDTSFPVVSFTIKEGNELSGEVTLYIKVQDKSEIESISVRLDDSTVLTKTTDYDTIVVDLNYLFKLENDEILLKPNDESFKVDGIRSLEVKVTDSNGNIGTSEQKDVIITQFKGWRIYQDFRNQLLGLEIDENGLIWYCSSYALFIYSSETNQLTQIPYDSVNLPGDFIAGFDLIDNSRAWIATRYHITEYDYNSNTFSSVEIPIEPVSGQIPEITCISLVNENLYIGTELSTLNNREWEYIAFTYAYNNSNFIIYENQAVKRITDMEYHPDGFLFISGLGGIDILKDNSISNNFSSSFYNFGYLNHYSMDNLIVDQNGIGWVEKTPNYAGIFRYENGWKGHNWGNDERYYPLLAHSDGLIYAGVQKTENGWTTDSIDFVIFSDDTFVYLSEFDTPFAVYKEYLKYYPNYFWSNYWENKKFAAEAPNGDIWMFVFDRLWRYRPSLSGSL